MLKKNIYTLFILLFISFSSCTKSPKDHSDTLISVNLINQNGLSETFNSEDRLKEFENVDFLGHQPYQKVLRVYGRDFAGNSRAFVTSYYPNGNIKQYLEVLNNRAYGFYREWYLDGQMKIETYVLGGLPDLNTAAEKSWLFDGCSQAWDEEGNLSAQIQYCKGELDGLSLYFHSNGNIWKRYPYHKNQLDGICETYTENGTLLQTVGYTRGEKEGPAYRYWDGISPAATENYCQDLLVEGFYYDISGALIAKIENGTGYRVTFGKTTLSELQEYRQGRQEGEVKVFDKNGHLVKIYHTKNRLKHGIEIEYMYKSPTDCTLIPKLQLSWFEGKIQGLVKTWYDNENQESQREMTNNHKNGLLTAWYRDGNLMMIEEYDFDKLIKGEYYQKGERSPISQVVAGKGVVTLFDSEGNFIRRIPYFNSKPQDF